VLLRVLGCVSTVWNTLHPWPFPSAQRLGLFASVWVGYS
jgi:hypothetical protein